VTPEIMWGTCSFLNLKQNAKTITHFHPRIGLMGNPIVADVFPLLEPIANRRKLNEMAKLNTHVRQLVTKYFRKRTKSWFPSRIHWWQKHRK
jgi:hypothetical protein